jgi:hypothetical protein
VRPLLALFLLLGAAHAWAQGAPSACDRIAAPAGAALGAPPAVEVWHPRDASPAPWDPRACVDRAPATAPRLGVALAGGFAFNGTLDGLLARVGAISTWPTLRYWSVSDRLWRPLVRDAFALAGPEATQRRPDFAPPDLRQGNGLYYAQQDNGSSATVVYRLRVWERSPAEAVVEMANVNPIHYRIVTLFDPGALQLVVSVRRVQPGAWGLYVLTRVDEGASRFALGHEASYVNRAATLYRLIAGIPSDQEPPLAP